MRKTIERCNNSDSRFAVVKNKYNKYLHFVKWSNNSLLSYGGTNFKLSFVFQISVMFNFDHTIYRTQDQNKYHIKTKSLL